MTRRLALLLMLFSGAVSAQLNRIETATAIALNVKYKIELAARCGTPVFKTPDLKLERFAIAIEIRTNGFSPDNFSQSDFEQVMAAVSSSDNAAAISKRALDGATTDTCRDANNIDYWNLLRGAAEILQK